MKTLAYISSLLLVSVASVASAQNLGIDLEAQRDATRGALFSWGVMKWVLIAAVVTFIGYKITGGSVGTKDGGEQGEESEDK